MKCIITKKAFPNRRGNGIIFYGAINILHLLLSRSRACWVYVGRSAEWMAVSPPSGPGDGCSDLGPSPAPPDLSLCVLIPGSGARSDTKPRILLLPGALVLSPCSWTNPVYWYFFCCCINSQLSCWQASDPIIVWKGSVDSQTLRRNQHLSFICSPEKVLF